jgi:hypothetical protein
MATSRSNQKPSEVL